MRNIKASRPAAAGVIGLSGLVLAGCAGSIETGYLPADPDTTNHTRAIIDLWNGSWIAAIVVGIIVYIMVLWTITMHRKRKGDEKLPRQTRVNLPLELMYTVVPLIMVGVLFKWTAQTTWDIKSLDEPVDVKIHVIGKQWSWDFNYVDENVYSAGIQAQLTGEVGVEDTLPTLYLPVNESVEFTLDSRDVIHSFWVPAFLFKMDVIPGQTNQFIVTPQQTGLYQGKCAELCGEFHASMLFNVAVEERDEYDAYIESLREEGNVGQIGLEYNRSANLSGEGEE